MQFDQKKGIVDIETAIGDGPVHPRLMRVVPSNIARVIGDFDEIEISKERCSEAN